MVDVPLLIEGGLWKWVGSVVVVYWYESLFFISIIVNSTTHSSEELQLQRLMNRDSSSREDAQARLGSQLPISEKVIYADIVVDNSGSKSELENHVKGLIKRLEMEAGWSWRLSWLLPPLGLLAAALTLWRQRHRKRKLKG